MPKKGKLFIGTSGYNYADWSGKFYPKGLPQNKWLEYYAGHFNTVELNVTFYRLPQEAAFKGWNKRTPKDFVYTVKGSRFITHIKRLKDCKRPVKLLHSRARHLKGKLSCILWQLPPRFKADKKRLTEFIKLLKVFKARQVFEFRDKSWFTGDIYEILRKHNACLCFADWPVLDAKMDTTADFVYIRRHGAGEIVYGGNYSLKALKKDAKDIRARLRQGRDVYIYFNNDKGCYAIKNALELRKLVTQVNGR